MAEKKELQAVAVGGVVGAVTVAAVATQDQMILPQAGHLGKASNLVAVVGGAALVAVAVMDKPRLKANLRAAAAGAGAAMLGIGITRALPSVFTSTGLRSGQVGRLAAPVATPLPLGAAVVRPAATV